MSEIPDTLAAAAAALRAGTVSSVELTVASIERADRFDEQLGTYLCRADDAALQAAKQADAELEAGHDRGPLHGIPVGVKDIVATADLPTTAQSLVLDPRWGERDDAVVVARLRAAGAVITGKTTTMFSTDFPHPEGGRDPKAKFEDAMPGVSDADQQRFYYSNMAELRGPALVPTPARA